MLQDIFLLDKDSWLIKFTAMKWRFSPSPLLALVEGNLNTRFVASDTELWTLSEVKLAERAFLFDVFCVVQNDGWFRLNILVICWNVENLYWTRDVCVFHSAEMPFSWQPFTHVMNQLVNKHDMNMSHSSGEYAPIFGRQRKYLDIYINDWYFLMETNWPAKYQGPNLKKTTSTSYIETVSNTRALTEINLSLYAKTEGFSSWTLIHSRNQSAEIMFYSRIKISL